MTSLSSDTNEPDSSPQQHPYFRIGLLEDFTYLPEVRDDEEPVTLTDGDQMVLLRRFFRGSCLDLERAHYDFAFYLDLDCRYPDEWISPIGDMFFAAFDRAILTAYAEKA